MGHGPAGDGFKITESLVFQLFLIDNDALAPTVGVVEFVLVDWSVKTAAVMQVEHQINLFIQNNRFDFLDCRIFRIVARNGCEFPIQVTMNPTAAFDNTDEVQIGDNPDISLVDFITGDEKGGRIEPARLVTLYAANDQHGASRMPGFKLVQRKIESLICTCGITGN